MNQGEILLALQDADLEIRRTEKKLDELPVKQKILAVRRKRAEVSALHSRADELVARLERAVKKNEDETATVSEKLETEQAKLMSGDITNPKEVQHLTREMDALRRRKDKLEMEDLELMERAEKARGQVEKVDTALAQLASQEERLTEEFTQAGGDLQKTAEKLKRKRKKLLGSLEGDLGSSYETLRESKGGVGAARLMDGVCSACRTELPAERLEELISGPDIALCPRCHRLLVVRGLPEEEA